MESVRSVRSATGFARDSSCRAVQDILEEAPLEVESLAKKCCFLGLLQAAVQYGFPEQSFLEEGYHKWFSGTGPFFFCKGSYSLLDLVFESSNRC